MFHTVSRGLVRMATRKPIKVSKIQALKVKDLVEDKPQLQLLPQQQPQPFNKNARVSWTMTKEERMKRVSWVNK